MFKNSLKNKIIIITLLILTFVGMLSVNTRINAAGSTTFDPDGGGSTHGQEKYKVGDVFKVTFGALSMNDNVFCVHHGQTFKPEGGVDYKVTCCYEITGTDILKDGVSIANVKSNKKLLDYAQGVAYILSLPNRWDGDTNQQTGSNEGKAQHVLWHYLYNIKASDGSNYANKIGMYEGKYDVKVNLTSEEQGYYNDAVSIFNGNRNKDYYAKYYMLEENKKNASQQELIILETTNETVTDNKDISITINKFDADNQDTKLNATFEVTFKQGIKKIDTKTLKTTGGTDSTTVTIGDTSKDVEVTIKETKTPTGYTGLSKDIKLTFEYKNHKWNLKDEDFDSSLVSVSGTNDITLNVENELNKKFSLNLEKLSSVSSKSVDGTTFKISISNVKAGTVEGASFTQNSILGAFDYLLDATAEGNLAETLSVTNGKIILNDIEVVNINDEVVITIEEEKPVDGFEKIESPIVIKIKWDSFTKNFKITSTEYAGMEEVEKIKMNNDTVEVSVKNYALINIKGQVWLDGQTGNKSSEVPDGKNNEEFGVEGIKVYLGLEGKILEDVEPFVTGEDGKYEFKEVKYQPGLSVIFEYDGINYIETVGAGYGTRGNDSDAEEIGRNVFNKKFTNINSKGAYSTEGIIDLTYDVSDETKAIVDTTGEIFKIKASTDEINNYETDFEFNCGLVKREFDMDLTTDLDFVEVKINGKTTDYKYSTDENGNATLDRNGGEITDKPTYNQYLYESDYNYDINDYFDNTEKYDNLTYDEKKDLAEDESQIKEEDVEKLEVFVTYKINVINQTNKDAYIYQITDYYSDDFEEIVECYYMDGNNKKTIDDDNISTSEISEKTRYSKSLINLYNKVTDVQTFYIKLKLKNFENMSELQVGNIAEISAYGTDEGYIDINSKPGNMINPENGEIRYEDDTDKAGSLNIIWTNKERTLTGVVWDDSSKGEPDGKYTDGEPLIDGVTVQLIELREVNGVTLEYIWQQTTTGSEKVLQTSLTGKNVNDVSNGGVENGQYKFVGFIPGNYIVRYKYGLDGESYDGNAYKSTYDKTGENRYQGNLELDVTEETRYSDAYDNEARRLGEMSIYAGETITKDSINDIDKHWMCADTNKFGVQIEDENDDKEIKNNVQEFDNDLKNNEQYSYDIQKIDFGIMKRPETEISLEKHLTALSIDVAGEGKILDAKFDLEKYLKGDSFENCIKGNSANLTSIMSTRTERGFWKVETDVNELMNGAELSAEYTYVISNNTKEPDYLTAQLVNAYEKLSSGFTCEFKFEENPEVVVTLMPGEGEGLYTYQKLLQDLENNTKILSRKDGHSNGYYLGKFYYTGEASTSEKPVTVQVNKIEELLNNEFLFDERINYSSYGDNHNNSSAYTSTSQETLVDYQHIEYNANGTKVLDSNNFAQDSYKIYDKNGTEIDVKIKIEPDAEGKERATITTEDGKDGYTIVQSRAGNKYLEPISVASDLSERVDIARKYVLTKTLNTNNIKDMLFDSYNAEILSYSVASGRRSTSSTPGNLEYSYSANSEDTLTKMNNESDEFWGETIIITAPTGNNTTLWIIIGTACAIIIVGGVFGIKKFVLKH